MMKALEQIRHDPANAETLEAYASGVVTGVMKQATPNVVGQLLSTIRTANEVNAMLVVALKACLVYIPGSEVHSWPPGHKMKEEAMRLGKAAIARAEAHP